MNDKAKAFDGFIEKNGLNWFIKEEHPDEFKTVAYRGHLDLQGERVPLFVVLDNSVFSFLRIIIPGAGVPAERRIEAESYLGDLNRRFKCFKYYLDEAESTIVLDISIPCTAADFNPDTVTGLIGQVLLPHLEEYYAKHKGFYDVVLSDMKLN